MTQHAPYYGGNTPYQGQPTMQQQLTYPRGAGQFIPSYIGGVGDLTRPGGMVSFSGLGASPSPDSGNLSAFGYSAASWLGAALGGGLVGYIAAKSRAGAVTGAAFTAGVAGISDAVTLGTQSKTGMAAVAGLAGLSALSWAIYRFKHSR